MNAYVVVCCVVVSLMILLECNQTLLQPPPCMCLRMFFSSMASDSVGCIAAPYLGHVRVRDLVRLPGILLSSRLSSSDFFCMT